MSSPIVFLIKIVTSFVSLFLIVSCASVRTDGVSVNTLGTAKAWIREDGIEYKAESNIDDVVRSIIRVLQTSMRWRSAKSIAKSVGSVFKGRDIERGKTARRESIDKRETRIALSGDEATTSQTRAAEQTERIVSTNNAAALQHRVSEETSRIISTNAANVEILKK